MYPIDLKNAGATRAEMLALKNNDAGECVCLLWCDFKSRVACKAARPLSFLSFGTQLSFFFSFSFLQCFWPCPFFFLQGPMLSWKSYNLNCFAKPIRCHPFNSFFVTTGRHYLHGCHFFATRGSTPLKNDHDEEIKSQIFLLKLLHVLLRKVRKEVSSVEGNEEYMEFFVIEPIAEPSACSFLPGAVNLANFFCSLQWVEKVTAQMIPKSSPFAKFCLAALILP